MNFFVSLRTMKRVIRILFIAICMVAGSANASYIFATEQVDNLMQTATAKPVRGGIEVTSTDQTRFEIYSITGQQIKSVTVSSESQTIELPNGCYIVRTPGWSKKVIVK